ncbi:MAG: hypothetical protein KDE33_08585 [Bacteroidetes bacterium]|nr:hypothetical protein [Bacteroidota bacterium]MCB9227782.1 hypothetical protein [Chitinophagales bacterium]
MHNIEPYWKWRDLYLAEEDERSPFYGREYSEFEYTHAIYNHIIHPQWDDISSPTLFIKILFADYDEGYCVIEMIGEWNDSIHNDIMFLKRDVIDKLIAEGIYRFILIGENVLNFHAEENDYYVEWYDDIIDEGGWIALLNFNEHVLREMQETEILMYLHHNKILDEIHWRKYTPDKLLIIVEDTLLKAIG